MAEEKRLVRVELELPKEAYDFLMLTLGDEKAVKAYLTGAIADNIRSDFETLSGGGAFAEALHERFKETVLKALEGLVKRRIKHLIFPHFFLFLGFEFFQGLLDFFGSPWIY